MPALVAGGELLGGACAGVSAGAWLLAGGVAARSRAASSESSLATSAGVSPAKDVVGAGPMAAPTPTPTASIAAARIAVTRSVGRRESSGGCA